MTCIPGYCGFRISSKIRKTRFEVESTCRKNPKCVAIDYSEKFAYGYLCDSTSYEGRVHDYVFCRVGNIITRVIPVYMNKVFFKKELLIFSH